MFPTKRAELDGIVKTAFWDFYTKELVRIRDGWVRELLSIDTDISEPMTYGVVLQKCIREIDRIACLPEKIIAEE